MIEKTLDNQQKKQEEKYSIPYHWFIQPESERGRSYFGVFSICFEFLNKEKLSSSNILDAGCGDGRLLKEITDLGCYNLHGIDYSEQAINFAKVLVPEAQINVGNLISSLPYPNDYFDYVFSLEVLEHIDPNQINKILNEFKRVLKSTGKLIISVPSINVPVVGTHYRHFSEQSLRSHLEPIFKINKIIGHDKKGWHILKGLYELIDNRYWTIKQPTAFYNKNIWPMFFNKCEAKYGKTLIVNCVK